MFWMLQKCSTYFIIHVIELKYAICSAHSLLAEVSYFGLVVRDLCYQGIARNN